MMVNMIKISMFIGNNPTSSITPLHYFWKSSWKILSPLYWINLYVHCRYRNKIRLKTQKMYYYYWEKKKLFRSTNYTGQGSVVIFSQSSTHNWRIILSIDSMPLTLLSVCSLSNICLLIAYLWMQELFTF